jgi:hypothetical protein
MGLHHGTLVTEHESSRLQIDNHISRRSGSPMPTPGAITGLVLGCSFILLAVWVTLIFNR